VLAAAVIGVVAGSSAAARSDAVGVTVTDTAAGPLDTQISSNDVWSGILDQTAAAKANFAALKLPLVRIHVGNDGDPVAMPEVKKGAWSMKALDVLVDDVTRTHQQPVLNVKFAPNWMWTCTKLGGSGRVADPTFQTFAEYMARLVSYYNHGSLTTETGQVISNPAGTSNRIVYWELWNEPDLSNETPCNPPSGQALTPTEYVTMWNAVTAKMLAVDPGLRFVGPATAGGQFGSSAGVGNDYITQLERDGKVKPYAISFHGYGYWENTAPDKWIFDGDNTGAGGIPDSVRTARLVHRTYPGTPIWITEMNVNADWGGDPHNRPASAFGAAWWASAYTQLAPAGVQLINQYDISESPQFGMIDDQTGRPLLQYWIVKTIDDAFPVGSERLSASSADPNVQVLAARRPDGKVSILVVDRRVDAANPRGGRGLPADVELTLNGLSATAITSKQIDASTSATNGPATATLPLGSPIAVHFPGYGLALVTVATNGGTTVPFRLIAPPVVSGTPRIGKVLRAGAARWSLAPAHSSGRWQLCRAARCTPIPGATHATLKLARAYAGRSVRYVVTATRGGATLSAPSRRVTVRR
jgi:hypothetical protein